MEQVYCELTETLIPWIEDRFGRVAAWSVMGVFITFPIAGVALAALWLTRA